MKTAEVIFSISVVYMSGCHCQASKIRFDIKEFAFRLARYFNITLLKFHSISIYNYNSLYEYLNYNIKSTLYFENRIRSHSQTNSKANR